MSDHLNLAQTSMLIRKPVADVFEAFTNPEITTRFWFTHSSGKLEEGKNATWTWKMYDLEVPLKVLKIIQNEKISIEWGDKEQRSLVKFDFRPLEDSTTYLTITHSGFQHSGDALVRQLVDSMGGFTLVIAGLKAWLEHGIELNLVADKFPMHIR